MNITANYYTTIKNQTIGKHAIQMTGRYEIAIFQLTAKPKILFT